MALPANADVVVVRGFWLDETTGQGVRLPNSSASATITFTPVPLSAMVPGAKTPNLRDLATSGWIKTRPRVATVNPVTGYFATLMVANDDPDLDAYGGRYVQFSGEDPFVIAVPYNASTTSADQAMVDALSTDLPELEVGDTVKAVWLTAASLLTTPQPTPAITYLTASQTLETVANGVDAHDADTNAHPDIRELIENFEAGATGSAGGVLSGSYPSPGFAVDMATQAELDNGLATKAPLNLAVRSVSASTTAVAGEFLKVNASSGARTVTPPSSPVTGQRVSVIKVDSSANVVTWSGATNSDANARLLTQWAGATFVWDGTVWLVYSVNVAGGTPDLSSVPASSLTGTIDDARIPAGIARDSEVTSAISAASTTDRDRANHTGSQASTTISDFTEAVQDAVAALLGAGSNITLNYNDAGNTLTVTSSGGGGGLDAEAVRDAIGVAVVGVGNVAVTVNDGADTITISTTATVNSTDAALRDRTTHTGAQAISTITGLQAALDAKVTRLNEGLLAWTYAEAFRLSTATRDANGAITTASVVWPDGSTGTFTTDTASATFLGAIDAYRVTYVPSSGPTLTVTQPAVTRDTTGGVTAQPALTVT